MSAWHEMLCAPSRPLQRRMSALGNVFLFATRGSGSSPFGFLTLVTFTGRLLYSSQIWMLGGEESLILIRFFYSSQIWSWGEKIVSLDSSTRAKCGCWGAGLEQVVDRHVLPGLCYRYWGSRYRHRPQRPRYRDEGQKALLPLPGTAGWVGRGGNFNLQICKS